MIYKGFGGDRMDLLLIRSANQNDYESLLPLFKQVHDLHVYERPDLYKENTTPVEYDFFNSQLIDVKQHIFVATTGIEIHGVVVLKEEEIADNSFMNARKVLFINSLCVTETKRNNGIGRKLVDFALEFGKCLEVDSIELGVSEKNQSAIRFYESSGLTTKSRRMEIRLN
jgi:diamine N-acetyltransferase